MASITDIQGQRGRWYVDTDGQAADGSPVTGSYLVGAVLDPPRFVLTRRILVDADGVDLPTGDKTLEVPTKGVPTRNTAGNRDRIKAAVLEDWNQWLGSLTHEDLAEARAAYQARKEEQEQRWKAQQAEWEEQKKKAEQHRPHIEKRLESALSYLDLLLHGIDGEDPDYQLSPDYLCSDYVASTLLGVADRALRNRFGSKRSTVRGLKFQRLKEGGCRIDGIEAWSGNWKYFRREGPSSFERKEDFGNCRIFRRPKVIQGSVVPEGILLKLSGVPTSSIENMNVADFYLPGEPVPSDLDVRELSKKLPGILYPIPDRAVALQYAANLIERVKALDTAEGIAAWARPDGSPENVRGNCALCGKPFTDLNSINRGIGPECWKYIDSSRNADSWAAATAIPNAWTPPPEELVWEGHPDEMPDDLRQLLTNS